MGRINHSGRIMIDDGTSIYSFGRTSYGWGSSFSYILYRAPVAADVRKMEAVSANTSPTTSVKKGGNKTARTWSVDVPVLARSMVKAGDRLIITGPTKLYDENSVIKTVHDPSTAAKVKAQAESWDKSADLIVVSAANGELEQKVSFDFAPVWDGVAVAEAALFLSATDGTLYRLE
jgi:hypothetical protein